MAKRSHVVNIANGILCNFLCSKFSLHSSQILKHSVNCFSETRRTFEQPKETRRWLCTMQRRDASSTAAAE